LGRWARDAVFALAGMAAGTTTVVLVSRPLRSELRSIHGSLGVVNQKLDELSEQRFSPPAPPRVAVDVDALARNLAATLPGAAPNRATAGRAQPGADDGANGRTEAGNWEHVRDVEQLLQQAASAKRWTRADRMQLIALLADAPEGERQRLRSEVARRINDGELVPTDLDPPY
jgi:hypothetical protein